MKTTLKKVRNSRAFTLAELLVAMTITLVLVSLTMVITGSAIDAWSGARTEIRAAGQAKIMLNSLGRDLESVVMRLGNNDSQWLIASAKDESIGPDGQPSPNAGRITFFTAASDRYDGNAGSQEKLVGSAANRNADEGGDVCSVSYQLAYEDPIWGDQSDNFSTFVLYRKLLDPKETYAGVTSEEDLEKAFDSKGGKNKLADLMCENIYEFTMTFVVAYRDNNGNNTTADIPVMSSNQSRGVVKSFAINGTGLAPNENTRSEYRGGRVASVELAITVLSDEGVTILKKSPFKNPEAKAKFIEENGYRYTRTVAMPQG